MSSESSASMRVTTQGVQGKVMSGILLRDDINQTEQSHTMDQKQMVEKQSTGGNSAFHAPL
jgi:hypothetical protein